MRLKIKQKNYLIGILLLGMVGMVQGCFLIYSFSQSSLSQEIETFSIEDFYAISTEKGVQDVAAKLTKALRDKILQETRLVEVDKDGDIQFKGTITGYEDGEDIDRPAQISISVEYSNPFQKEFEFKKGNRKTFSERDKKRDISTGDLSRQKETTSEEKEKSNEQVVKELIDKLVEQILKKSIYQW